MRTRQGPVPSTDSGKEATQKKSRNEKKQSKKDEHLCPPMSPTCTRMKQRQIFFLFFSSLSLRSLFHLYRGYAFILLQRVLAVLSSLGYVPIMWPRLHPRGITLSATIKSVKSNTLTPCPTVGSVSGVEHTKFDFTVDDEKGWHLEQYMINSCHTWKMYCVNCRPIATIASRQSVQ